MSDDHDHQSDAVKYAVRGVQHGRMRSGYQIHDEKLFVDEHSELGKQLHEYMSSYLTDRSGFADLVQGMSMADNEGKLTVERLKGIRDNLRHNAHPWYLEVSVRNFELGKIGPPLYERTWRSFMEAADERGRLIEIRRHGLKTRGRGYYVTIDGCVIATNDNLTWERAKQVYTYFVMRSDG